MGNTTSAGEWRLNITEDKNSFEIVARRPNEREHVAVVKGKANARLIYAAPNMLEALEVALNELELWDASNKGQDRDTANALAAVRLAIEKATGEDLPR